MSTCRFRLLVLGTAYLTFGMGLFNLFFSAEYLYNPNPQPLVPYLILQTIHLLVVLGLRWIYETPLETVMEAARLAGGPWAQRQVTVNSDGAKQRRLEPFAVISDYSGEDYCYYTQAGAIITVALAHWTFWLWMILPEYNRVTMPLGLAGAILVLRHRMDFLGPAYQFAKDIEVENAAAGISRDPFPSMFDV